MQPISQEYADLNRELHERSEKYGSGAWRKADHVIVTVADHGYGSVLDYGCGKGTLAENVGSAFPVFEYDPAIPGKDGRPDSADLVVCFDVLEHVEPERLAATIADLRSLAKEELFVTIATRPSQQTLADGRNAHLIIEDADWWRQQFRSEDWRVTMWDVHRGEVWGRLRPLHKVGHIKSKMAVSHENRLLQVLENIARVPDRLTELHKLKHEENDRKAVLICFGPSLKQSWPAAALSQWDEKTDLFTVSAAHKFMIERGVIPKAHIDCDPRPHKVTQMGDAHPAVEYWLASCIHPSYIDHVGGGKRTALWHAYNGDPSLDVLEHEPGQRLIVGGGSVGLRSLSLLYHLGYRRFEVHGMDCSFTETGKQWAGEHHGKIKDEVEITLGDGRTFLTAPALILYFRYFFKQLFWMHDATVDLHGDGMLQHAMRLRNVPAGRN